MIISPIILPEIKVISLYCISTMLKKIKVKDKKANITKFEFFPEESNRKTVENKIY